MSAERQLRLSRPKEFHKKRRDFSAFILELLGPYDVWRQDEKRFRSCCPIHGGDNPTGFSISKQGYWTCWKTCGSGNIVELIVKVRGVSFTQAKKIVEDMPNVFVDLSEFLTGRQKAVPLVREADIKAYSGTCPRLLTKRGFSKRALQAFEIGYDAYNYRVVIPVRDADRKLVGITYRTAMPGDDGPKYWHDHFVKTEHLWGFYKWKQKYVKSLYLVEGQLDVVRMWQMGFAACAIMGSSISDQQVELLLNHQKCSRIVLAFDNDEAGEKATRETQSLLAKTPLGRKLYLAEYETKDPGELTTENKIKVYPWYTKLMKR